MIDADFLELPLTSPVLIMAIVLGLVLVVPLLSRILRIPEIIGLILAGLVIGPHGLNVLARDQTIVLWGTIGLLYIMFLAGLEVDFHEFVRTRRRSALFGFLSFIIPQAIGALLGRWIYGFSWTTAILLASMFASFTLLNYPIVSRLGLMRREAVTVTVGGTLLTDTLALLVLAVIAESVRYDLTLAFGARLLAAGGLFLFLLLWGVPRLSRWFFRVAGQEGSAQFLFVLVVVFLSAGLSKLAGIEPIIGAFLAGFTLNRLIPPQGPLMNRVQFVGHTLFIPFFLLSVGMIVDLGAFLGDPRSWSVALFMSAAVILTKYAAALLTRRLLGYSRDEGLVIFGLSVTQAAATLAAVIIGYELEIFDAAILNGTILMIFSTCLLSAWVTEHYGRRLALHEAAAAAPAEAVPPRILVPLAQPATADRIMDLAFALRDPASREPVYPLRVVPDEEDVEAHVAFSEKLLLHSVTYGAAADIPISPIVRVALHTADGIRRAATELRVNLIILGWGPQTTTGSVVFGGLLDELLRRYQDRVIACRAPQPLNTTQRVSLVIPPYADREPRFEESLALTLRLAARFGADVRIFCGSGVRPLAQRLLGGMDRATPIEWTKTAQWSDVRALLESDWPPDDLFVFLAARRGALSWRPPIERLFADLAARHPEARLLMMYPPAFHDLPGAATERPSTKRPLCFLPSDGGLYPAQPPESSLRTLLDTLLGDYFGHRPEHLAALRAQLMGVAAQFPIELAPGIVLLHAHCTEVETPVLFVGTLSEPMPLIHQAEPVRGVFVLLSPLHFAPDQHVQNLASLARLLQVPGATEQLLSANTADALRTALNNLASAS